MNVTKAKSIHFWEGQMFHLASLFVLLSLTWIAWQWLNQPCPLAFWIAVAFPVLHQVFVWLAWRGELATSFTSRWMGFPGYLVLFFVLFFGRFVALGVLAWLDQGSLGLPPGIQASMTILLLIPGLYAIYSVIRYFGMRRAAGADHFDSRYRDRPLVQKGIFRFTANGMYVFAFLLFWAIAVGFNSSAALTVAAFSHAYIWVHYFATEKPDMDFLYG